MLLRYAVTHNPTPLRNPIRRHSRFVTPFSHWTDLSRSLAKMAALSLASQGQPVPEPGGCASQPEDTRRLLGVLGVFSHTANLVVRRTIRETWLTLAHASLVTKFVMRSQGDDRVAQEASKHGDVVMLDAPAAMSKDVGPLWSSMLWLACAPRAWPGADMIGHAEDDTYLHLPGIVSHLRHTASIPRDSEGRARILWGTFETFHWNENLHLPEKYWNRFNVETLFSNPCRRRTIEHMRHSKKELQYTGVYTNHHLSSRRALCTFCPRPSRAWWQRIARWAERRGPSSSGATTRLADTSA